MPGLGYDGSILGAPAIVSAYLGLTAAQIISNFELYVDDTSELSSTEELALLNKIYRKVLTYKPWECTKSEWVTTTNGLTLIALPVDFAYFVENQNYTDNSIETNYGQAPKAVYINNSPYRIVNWSDRRQYQNTSDVCYADISAGYLRFPVAPRSGLTLSADYVFIPPDLTLTDSPIFPAAFHPMLYHGMAVDDMIIQLFDKARSYAPANQAAFDSYLADFSYHNANLLNN